MLPENWALSFCISELVTCLLSSTIDGICLILGIIVHWELGPAAATSLFKEENQFVTGIDHWLCRYLNRFVRLHIYFIIDKLIP